DRETENRQDLILTDFANGRCLDIIRLADNSFVITGWVIEGGGSPNRFPFIAKLSESGEFLWENVFDEFNNVCAGVSLYQDKNGFVWLCGVVNVAPDDEENPSGQAFLFKLDNAGNKIEEHLYLPNQYDSFIDIIYLDDNQAIITGKLDTDKNGITWLDGNRESVISMSLGPEEGCGTPWGVRLPSGNLLIADCIMGFEANGAVDGRIFILDSIGNPIREFKFEKSLQEYLYRVEQAPDGGILIGGRLVPNEEQAWLLKTNCMGFLTEPESNYDYTLNDLEIEFQNLSQFVYPDSIDGGHFIWEIDGEEFSREENPSYSFTESGAFNITLKGIVCSDTSVYNQCISLDGTECWALGLEENDFENRVSISPNPARDWLTINTQERIVGIGIYDLQGRLMATKINASFSISEFPAGVYLLEIELGSGDLVREKLVVE
ncbi:T9SS type A sorting domain-containing protein, partial [Chitinophagales bacterium]|nr:T9SS type A sorting domain-containing protein [Chitinophagales bacterium]